MITLLRLYSVSLLPPPSEALSRGVAECLQSRVCGKFGPKLPIAPFCGNHVIPEEKPTSRYLSFLDECIGDLALIEKVTSQLAAITLPYSRSYVHLPEGRSESVNECIGLILQPREPTSRQLVTRLVSGGLVKAVDFWRDLCRLASGKT